MLNLAKLAQMLTLTLCSGPALAGITVVPYGQGWGWEYPYPHCYSCGVIVGPDNPLRRGEGGAGRNENAVLESDQLTDQAAISRLRGAGADLVLRVQAACSMFYGQPWFGDSRRVYADFSTAAVKGLGHDAIWTCAVDDGNTIYKSFCQSGSAHADGLSCAQ